MRFCRTVMKSSLTIGLALLVAKTYGADVARIEGTEVTIPAVLEGKTVFLDANAAARAFGWEPKYVGEGRMLIACKAKVCVPVRLTSQTKRMRGDTVFVRAETLGPALGFSVTGSGGVLLRRTESAAANTAAVPAYNSVWGAGRGFQVGQTLPDIPLYDMDGKEVRFGQYLGKKYILYGWASW